MLNSADSEIYPAHKCYNCWHFNIDEQDKILDYEVYAYFHCFLLLFFCLFFYLVCLFCVCVCVCVCVSVSVCVFYFFIFFFYFFE